MYIFESLGFLGGGGCFKSSNVSTALAELISPLATPLTLACLSSGHRSNVMGHNAQLTSPGSGPVYPQGRPGHVTPSLWSCDLIMFCPCHLDTWGPGCTDQFPYLHNTVLIYITGADGTVPGTRVDLTRQSLSKLNTPPLKYGQNLFEILLYSDSIKKTNINIQLLKNMKCKFRQFSDFKVIFLRHFSNIFQTLFKYIPILTGYSCKTFVP